MGINGYLQIAGPVFPLASVRVAVFDMSVHLRRKSWERLTHYFDTGDERSNDSAPVDARCACDTTASLDAKERALSHLLRY